MRCIIVDDEPLAHDILSDYVSKLKNLELINTYTNPIEAFSSIERDKIELIFLDVQMPELTGIQFMKLLGNKAKVILTTAYPEYAIDGYEHNVVDYLLKPISFEKFLAASNRVKEYIELKNNKTSKSSEYFFINASHKLHKILYNDILYLEGFKDYTKIHLVSATSPLLILHNLKYFEDLNFHEISDVVNLSEGRICQLHAEALELLKEHLENGKIDILAA